MMELKENLLIPQEPLVTAPVEKLSVIVPTNDPEKVIESINPIKKKRASSITMSRLKVPSLDSSGEGSPKSSSPKSSSPKSSSPKSSSPKSSSPKQSSPKQSSPKLSPKISPRALDIENSEDIPPKTSRSRRSSFIGKLGGMSPKLFQNKKLSIGENSEDSSPNSLEKITPTENSPRAVEKDSEIVVNQLATPPTLINEIQIKNISPELHELSLISGSSRRTSELIPENLSGIRSKSVKRLSEKFEIDIPKEHVFTNIKGNILFNDSNEEYKIFVFNKEIDDPYIYCIGINDVINGNISYNLVRNNYRGKYIYYNIFDNSIHTSMDDNQEDRYIVFNILSKNWGMDNLYPIFISCCSRKITISKIIGLYYRLMDFVLEQK